MASRSWFDIRDLFLNLNWKTGSKMLAQAQCDLKEAIVLMRSCSFPDAAIITSVVDEMVEECSIFAVAGALTRSKNAIANVYGIFMKHRHHLCTMQDALMPLKIATELYEHPMSMAWYCYNSERLNQPLSMAKQLLQKAMKKGERDAFYVYGQLYKDLPCLKIAFEMGYMIAGVEYARIAMLLPRIEMLGNMIRVGYYGYPFVHCLEQELFKYDALSLQACYLFGKYLQGNIQKSDNEGNILIFGYARGGNVAKAAPVMAAFYEKQNAACRAAVDMFSLCALRMKICKDMRIYISKFIWMTRAEAFY